MSEQQIHTKLKQAFGTDDLAWLRKRLRKRIEREGNLGERLLITTPSEAQRRSIERFLGRPGEFGKHVSVKIADLHAILKPLGAADLQSALELLDGPIVSIRQRRAQERSEWLAVVNEISPNFNEAGIDTQKLLFLVDCGILKRCLDQPEEGRELLTNLLKVVQLLRAATCEGRKLCRAELAACTLGDSHSLDAGSSALSVLKHLYGMPGSDDYVFWSSTGVAVDETSTSVLTLNLRFASGDLAPAINAFASAGEPCRVTLKTIRRGLAVSADEDVYLCENPAVLHAAASRLKTHSKAMICTEGQPSFACQTLLKKLSDAGVRLNYHGDFDWGGVKIANFVFRLVSSVRGWRYGVADYKKLTGGFILKGLPAEAIWDSQLSIEMQRCGRGYHEEMVLDELIGDLSQHTNM